MLLGWRCPVCGASGRIPCATCHSSMRAAGQVPAIAGVDQVWALLSYRGAARELVARLKFRNQRACVAWLGAGMAGLVTERIDVVTWAPATPTHVRTRGFDHGALLARAVAAGLRVPCIRLLDRGRGSALTGRTAAARSDGPSLRARSTSLEGRSVLLVDDVITTGTTLRVAAACIRERGAAHVYAVAAAYTPPPTAR